MLIIKLKMRGDKGSPCNIPLSLSLEMLDTASLGLRCDSYSIDTLLVQ